MEVAVRTELVVTRFLAQTPQAAATLVEPMVEVAVVAQAFQVVAAALVMTAQVVAVAVTVLAVVQPQEVPMTTVAQEALVAHQASLALL